MIRVMEKHAFYTRLLAGQAATWSIAEGVCFASCREHLEWGMALRIQRGVLSGEQTRQILARRFTDAERYQNYLLSLDPRCGFAIWHALPTLSESVKSLDGIQQQQLVLAGLEYLTE